MANYSTIFPIASEGASTKERLQGRIILGYSGNSTTNDLGFLKNVTTTAGVSSSVKKLGSSSLSFNGSQNSALSFRINEILRQSRSFSISCWVYFNSFNYGGPFASWDANTLASGQLNLLNDGGTTPTIFKWYLSGSNFYTLAFGTGAIVTGQWYWMLCELDTIGLTAKVYLNNVLKDSIALSSGFILNTGGDTFGLGGYSIASGGTTNMNGYLDEFCILSGNTTPTERDWLWNSGNGNSLI